MFLSKKSILHK